MSAKKKVNVGGGQPLGQNPFDLLSGAGLPAGRQETTPPGEKAGEARPPPAKRGRIEIRREKSGRAGKIVTTATAFQGACPDEQKLWMKELRKRCGAGGTWRPGAIEIQGDCREEVVAFFAEKGFRPVLAGG